MDVVQVKDLMTDMFTTSGQVREALLCLFFSLEHNLVFHGRSIITLSIVV